MFTPSFHVIDFIFNIDYIVTPPTKMHKQKVHFCPFCLCVVTLLTDSNLIPPPRKLGTSLLKGKQTSALERLPF